VSKVQETGRRVDDRGNHCVWLHSTAGASSSSVCTVCLAGTYSTTLGVSLWSDCCQCINDPESHCDRCCKLWHMHLVSGRSILERLWFASIACYLVVNAVGYDSTQAGGSSSSVCNLCLTGSYSSSSGMLEGCRRLRLRGS